MKMHPLPSIAVCSAVLGMASSAYSQITVSQNVTIALVESYTAPALPAKNQSGVAIAGAEPVDFNSFSVTSRGITTNTEESGTKIVTVRISNKQVLEDLVDVGVIPSITGYSIQLIGTPDESGYVDSRFHLVKRGETPIDISEYLFVGDGGASAENYSYRSVQVVEPARTTVTGKANGKGLISLTYESSNSTLDMQGVATWSETLRNVGTAPNQVAVWMPGSASVTGITGSLAVPSEQPAESEVVEDVEDDEDDSVLEGRFSVSAGVVTIIR